ncbi:MAG: hypothetical protein AAF961_01915 [Planctomycetota bacterium]
MSTCIHVSTPSRLHFGLLRIARQSGAEYGGLGAMIDAPRIMLEARRSQHWDVKGPAADRALQFAKLASSQFSSEQEPLGALRIRIARSIPSHRGLGGGTQLALAIAEAARCAFGLPTLSIGQLAAAVGRGRRSAVGSHGFRQGGLIWETGRRPSEGLGRLAHRLELPSAWRFLLITERRSVGLSGEIESEVFKRLPPTPDDDAKRLERLAECDILPAVRANNFAAVGEALYEYGRLSGECFASVQGGPYASGQIASCVNRLRSWGIAGVGQSSWGPTVFALVESAAAANAILRDLAQLDQGEQCELSIARPDNRGAMIVSQPVDSGPVVPSSIR